MTIESAQTQLMSFADVRMATSPTVPRGEPIDSISKEYDQNLEDTAKNQAKILLLSKLVPLTEESFRTGQNLSSDKINKIKIQLKQALREALLDCDEIIGEVGEKIVAARNQTMEMYNQLNKKQTIERKGIRENSLHLAELEERMSERESFFQFRVKTHLKEIAHAWYQKLQSPETKN